MKDNVKTLKNSYIFATIFILSLLSLIFFYSLGYRLTRNLKIGKVGQIVLKIPMSETLVFIDQSKKIITTKDMEELKIFLSPTKHSVIVSRDSYFPWKKDFEIKSENTLEFTPIFVSQNPSGSIVTSKDPEYTKIMNLIKNNTLPTKNNTKISLDGSVSLWVEENTIFAKKGEKIFEVITPQYEIKNVDFYKDRNDSIVFSSGIGVFVIEIDKEGSQNFMPVYKGENPTFVNTDPNYLYILDISSLMQVVI